MIDDRVSEDLPNKLKRAVRFLVVLGGFIGPDRVEDLPGSDFADRTVPQRLLHQLEEPLSLADGSLGELVPPVRCNVGLRDGFERVHRGDLRDVFLAPPALGRIDAVRQMPLRLVTSGASLFEAHLRIGSERELFLDSAGSAELYPP
nr:hypothetical protein [Amaricoccus solimangrovi]